jgi:hypothetical protein
MMLGRLELDLLAFSAKSVGAIAVVATREHRNERLEMPKLKPPESRELGSNDFQRPRQLLISAVPKFAHEGRSEKCPHGLITSCNRCRWFKTTHILDRNCEAALREPKLTEQHIWIRAVELSNQEKQHELDLVLESATFARSERLRSFLLYVCRREMEGRAGELNEYLVGVEALGRPPNYSPAEDSSVRSRAWELRQKLLTLYTSERCDATLRIDLPRGGYAPQYLARRQDTSEEVRVPPKIPVPDTHFEVPSPTPRSIGRPMLIGILSGLAVVLMAIGANYFWQTPLTEGVDPVIRQALGPLLTPGSSNMLVMANGLYLLIRPDVPAGTIDEHLYPVPSELYGEYRLKHPLGPDTRLTMFISDNTVQMGYINGLVTISSILQRASQPFNVVPERVVTPSMIRNRNVILFGAPQDSLAVTAVLARGAYHFGYDKAHDIVIQKGRSPLSDSPYHRNRRHDPEASVTYGLITVMPSLGTESQAKRTIVFSGITSVGAQGAAEFFASSRYMTELQNRFRKAGAADFPPAYQVVVRCRAYDTLLVSFEYADSEILFQTK